MGHTGALCTGEASGGAGGHQGDAGATRGEGTSEGKSGAHRADDEPAQRARGDGEARGGDHPAPAHIPCCAPGGSVGYIRTTIKITAETNIEIAKSLPALQSKVVPYHFGVV